MPSETVVASAARRFGIESLAALSSLVQVAIIGRTLGAQGTGHVLLAIAATQILKTVFAVGTPVAVVWQLPRREGDVRQVTATGLFVGLAAVFLLGLAFVPLQVVLGEMALVRFWPLIVLATGTQVVGDHLVGSLRALDHLVSANRARVLQSVVSLAGVAVGGFVFAAPHLVLLGWSTGWILYPAAAGAALASRGLLGLRSSPSILREQLAYGARVFTGLVCSQATARADLLLVGAILGSAAAGIYGVALRIIEFLNLVPNAISFVSYPAAARAAVGKEPSQVLTAVLATLVAAGAMALVIAGLAPGMLPLLVGDGFSASIAPLRVLLPGAVLLSCAKVLFPELLARDRTAAFVLLNAASLALLVVLDLVLIPRFGVLGAAYASTSTYVLLAAAAAVVTRQVIIGTRPFPSTSGRTST